MATRKRRKSDTIVGRLRAADPFELIRWLARSQPDPRKALAELVQNSIDAQARHIRITRLRDRGVATLHVVDDGEGVIPEVDRVEALTYIATHIGHSRKRNLTPEQRRELMLQGKYGIGLLGFWSIGQILEMRSYVPGQPPQLLRMFEDSPRYEIERVRGRLQLDERRTEVIVRALHRPAFLSLTARRMADYLAAELRGQILAHDVQILVHDKIARGRAPKVLEVRPTRFEGERLDLPDQVPVHGFSPFRVELYLVPAPGTGEARVAVSAAGTIVYEDIQDFEVADFRRGLWAEARLSGLIDFADFQVSPGTRRGVLPDQAALAFATALRRFEAEIEKQLETIDARASAAVEANLVRQLERAFRDVPRLAPEYDFFGVRERAPFTTPDGKKQGDGEGSGSETGTEIVEGVPLPLVSEADGEEGLTLLPAGPLASLHVVPAQTRVERYGERRLRAQPRDAGGTLLREGVIVHWQLSSDLARLQHTVGYETVLQAGSEVGTVSLRAIATAGERSAEAEATIDIVETLPASEAARAGIPEPIFISEPAAGWRSRIVDQRWQVNSAHADFRTAAESPRRKLRYLAALLAKEVVMHSFPAPQLAPALERLVEILTITERRLERG
jgi:hypothetical protein